MVRIHRTREERAIDEGKAKLLSPRQVKKRGRRPKPTTTTGENIEQLDAAMAKARRRVSSQDRRFVEIYIEQGFKGPEEAATRAGFTQRGIGWKLVERLAHLIEAERARAFMATQMSTDEALTRVAELARTGGAVQMDVEGKPVWVGGDPKLKLAALRTVLEVEGALGKGAPTDEQKRAMVRDIEKLVGHLKGMKSEKKDAARELSEGATSPDSDVIEADAVVLDGPQGVSQPRVHHK